MRRRFGLLAAASVLAALAVPASAYYHFVYYLGSGTAVAKFDLNALPDKTVRFFVSEAGPTAYSANDNFASVVAQIRHAAQVWNGVGTSDLRVGFGGFERANTLQNTPAADVVFDDLPPGLLGFGGPTVTATPVVPEKAAPWVPIVRSAIHINVNGVVAPFPSYRESFFLVLVHEMGHALGLQHTFTSSAMSTATTSAVSLANPLDVDDVAGISALYPNAAFARNGSISGRITSGGSGLHLESVVAIRPGVGAVSAFTAPDGTYRIDGVPPGQYYVYAHALPPDADIKGPWYADGTVAAASGPTNSLFYPAATDQLSATPVTVKASEVAADIDISLNSIPAIPIYDVSVYSYFNNNTVAIKPGYLNRVAGKATVVASGAGLGSNGQAPGLDVKFMGNSVIVGTGGVRPYLAAGYTYIALDVGFFLSGPLGPQHLIVNTPGFMHVLPSAVRLTEQNPPTIGSVTDNSDGTLTITGTNWSTGSAVYFNGLAASVKSLKLDEGAASAVVTPPAGIANQTVVLTVYNPDGQNSQFVQSAKPATYTYPDSATPVIVAVEPSSLPAGAEATVTITGSNFHFTPGQTAAGFGTSDVAVRQIFVLDANHLQANVAVAPGAALSNPDVSVFSGFQMTTANSGFHIMPAAAGLPRPYPTLTNAWPGLNGVYAGAIVSMYGANLAVPGTTPSLTFNGKPAVILYSSPGQINLQIPPDLTPGLASFRLFNGAVNGYPQAINIDTLPAAVTAIQNTAGVSIGASSHTANQGDLLTVSLTGFAPDNAAIEPERVQVGVNGVMHSALTVASSAPGTWQVSFLLRQDEAAGDSQAVVVYLDGRSSYPTTISVAGSGALLAAAARRGN